MITEQLSLYKLMILYMLNKSTYMLTYTQIADFFLSTEITYFIQLKNALNDLQYKKMIDEHTSKTQQKFSITEIGIETLNFFEKEIPDNAIDKINNYLNENKIRLRTESAITSDIEEIEDNNYKVNLEINESKGSLLNITINLPDADTATTMCEKWKNSARDIYNYIIKKLI